MLRKFGRKENWEEQNKEKREKGRKRIKGNTEMRKLNLEMEREVTENKGKKELRKEENEKGKRKRIKGR